MSPSERALSGISEALSAAYDVMAADGVEAERAASLAVAAERDGRDPVAWAEHFVRLRQAIREAVR